MTSNNRPKTARRSFVQQFTALGVVAAMADIPVARGAQEGKSGSKVQPSVSVNAAKRRDETLLRLGGNGDDFPMTWLADGRQLVAVQDGVGWLKDPKGEYNSSLWTLSGDPHDARFENVSCYPELLNILYTEDIARYYPFGTLAVGGYIYQYLSAQAGPPSSRDLSWICAKLIYSPDNGGTWYNQDGSTPVVWETRKQRSRRNMVFFQEPQQAFSLPAILQMGCNYKANRDGYVYVYAPNGVTDGTMNQLVMFRVRKERVLHRHAYEYFAGLRPDGSASWSRRIEARAPAHVFPRGWVNRGSLVMESWVPSVVYNVPLGVYMMASWGVGVASDGSMFGKPSYLGLWVAPEPWGPWRQILEETAWTPGGDQAARCYMPQIAPKWIAPDGKSFWLVWTDYQIKATDDCRNAMDEWGEALLPNPSLQGTRDEAMRKVGAKARSCQPYYAFNTQRVDLVTA
jgi:hypothetical protein